jgi:hypothetical protein
MAIAEQWHIKTRARACSETGRHFADGEAIQTALFRGDEEDGFVRRDYSLEAWEARSAEAEPAFSAWRTVYRTPVTEEKPQVVRKENAEDLLKRLVEEDEEFTENVRYILAVMLERQKLLRETDQQRMPNGILRVYEHRKNGDVFLIRDPDIPLDQVEKVQTEVLMLLEHGGRRPEAAETQDQGPVPGEGSGGGPAAAAGGAASPSDPSDPCPANEPGTCGEAAPAGLVATDAAKCATTSGGSDGADEEE